MNITKHDYFLDSVNAITSTQFGVIKELRKHKKVLGTKS